MNATQSGWDLIPRDLLNHPRILWLTPYRWRFRNFNGKSQDSGLTFDVHTVERQHLQRLAVQIVMDGPTKWQAVANKELWTSGPELALYVACVRWLLEQMAPAIETQVGRLPSSWQTLDDEQLAAQVEQQRSVLWPHWVARDTGAAIPVSLRHVQGMAWAALRSGLLRQTDAAQPSRKAIRDWVSAVRLGNQDSPPSIGLSFRAALGDVGLEVHNLFDALDQLDVHDDHLDELEGAMATVLARALRAQSGKLAKNRRRDFRLEMRTMFHLHPPNVGMGTWDEITAHAEATVSGIRGRKPEAITNYASKHRTAFDAHLAQARIADQHPRYRLPERDDL